MKELSFPDFYQTPEKMRSFREAYRHACRDRAWSFTVACSRFPEYDRYRTIWADEIWKWLYGRNPREISSLTKLAWKVGWDRVNDQGKYCNCLDFNERNQRLYLGDGLILYLGLLKDEIEKLYGVTK